MREKNSCINLLDESFPGIRANILRGAKLSFAWLGKTFFKEEKGEAVSHVGFLEYPMLIDDRECKVGALHASEAIPLYDKGYLMVHGNWPKMRPFMIPPLSRC